MTTTLLHGDCVEAMRAMEESSIGAVVCDPPYGLEFMGRDWDAPWKKGAGTGEHNARLNPQVWADGANRHPRPVYTGGTNPTCRNCGGTKNGNDRQSRRACRCDAPDFPDTNTPRMRAYQDWCEQWAREAFRVLKPGAYLLAFGGTRTYHRMACAIEDAGFVIKDSLHWLYGSGFPKSMAIDKALDKRRKDEDATARVAAWLRDRLAEAGKNRAEIDAHFGSANIGQYWFSPHRNAQVPAWDKWLWLKGWLGFGDDMDAEVWRLNGRKGQPGEAWHEREVLGKSDELFGRKSGIGNATEGHYTVGGTKAEAYDITAPATDLARRWDGYGTALKPAHEPIILAQKPLDGTYANNVARHGVGALDIDGCRVGTTTSDDYGRSTTKADGTLSLSRAEGYGLAEMPYTPSAAGRWPPNLLLTHTSLPVARLSAIISPDANAEIRGYFHGYDRVSALRQDRRRAQPETPEILQPRVPQRGDAWPSDEAAGRDSLPTVPADLPMPPGMGEGRATEVLQRDLPLGAPAHPPGSGQSALWQAEHGNGQDEDGQGRTVAGTGPDAARRDAPGLEGRHLYPPGLPVHLTQPLVGRGSGLGTGDAPDQEAWAAVHPRTPPRDGALPGSPADLAGIGTPHQRRQGRQCARQPGVTGDGGALASAPGDGAGTGQASPAEPPLDVLAADVPPEWASYFRLTGEDLGCVPVGTRRVRGNGAHERHNTAEAHNRTPSMGRTGEDWQTRGHGDADGLETVAAWSCVENCPVRLLDEQSGERATGGPGVTRQTESIHGPAGLGSRKTRATIGYADTGGASRFFPTFAFEADDFAPFIYCAKSSRSERNRGLEGLPERETRAYEGGVIASAKTPNAPGGRRTGQNVHPTVKPLALMRWLVRLVTPPGETCLDPFLGSGTTAVACIAEGRDCIGIEQDSSYLEISRLRIAHAQQQATAAAARPVNLRLPSIPPANGSDDKASQGSLGHDFANTGED